MQEVTIVEREPVLKIALSGEIDSKNADEMLEVVAGAYQEKPADIEFDCTALQFIDSTTIGTIVKIRNQVVKDGHSVKLNHLQARLKKLFVICALDRLMEIA